MVASRRTIGSCNDETRVQDEGMAGVVDQALEGQTAQTMQANQEAPHVTTINSIGNATNSLLHDSLPTLVEDTGAHLDGMNGKLSHLVENEKLVAVSLDKKENLNEVGPTAQSINVLCEMAKGRDEMISIAQISKAHDSDPRLFCSKPSHMIDGPVLISPTHVLDEEIVISPEACFDATKPPLPGPLISGYSWHFSCGAWCLIPKNHSLHSDNNHHIGDTSDNWEDEEVGDKNLEEVLGGDDFVPNSQLNLDFPSSDKDGSDDSSSDFEEKIRRMFLDSNSGKTTTEHTKHGKTPSEGKRRSERQKKPSSRWTEEAGYLAQPPKSARKKGTGSNTLSPEVPDKKKPRLEDSAVSAKRSLDFLNDQPGSSEEDKPE
ncbi:uncharacterized protein LOC120276971 [Dioscorea cayenensis subsp. rotundata]|uniref:Uncharacterized protein LOC120276971 n=1 Tax=Dioscorea cayennensis subsp. rotundata TaxID=55577 RepID=A0AB40CI09_DIOCR|nr:uncharacterized protein LOC120276971 [Dioscorea cayenensis subsp. rotundata]